MKKLSIFSVVLFALVMAGPALAEPKAKSVILHCGCTWDGFAAGMAYGENTVSAKSRGHDGHLVGSIDSCYSGEIEVGEGIFEPVFTDFVRNGDDCQLSGPPLGDPIADCSSFEFPPAADDPCGTEVID